MTEADNAELVPLRRSLEAIELAYPVLIPMGQKLNPDWDYRSGHIEALLILGLVDSDPKGLLAAVLACDDCAYACLREMILNDPGFELELTRSRVVPEDKPPACAMGDPWLEAVLSRA